MAGFLVCATPEMVRASRHSETVRKRFIIQFLQKVGKILAQKYRNYKGPLGRVVRTVVADEIASFENLDLSPRRAMRSAPGECPLYYKVLSYQEVVGDGWSRGS